MAFEFLKTCISNYVEDALLTLNVSRTFSVKLVACCSPANFFALLMVQTIMNMPHLTVQALALTLRHLKQFGFERILFEGASFRSLSNTTEMTLSANTLQQLEVLSALFVIFSKNIKTPVFLKYIRDSLKTSSSLFQVVRNNLDGSQSGSLFHNMNQTLTVYGSRLLRHWVRLIFFSS